MLLVIALILGFIIGKPSSSSLRYRDGLLAIVFGVIFAWISTYWLSLFYLKGSSVIYSDLIEYCTGVTTPKALMAGVSSKRSVLPMLLPRAFYAELGVFDALAFGALCSSFAVGFLFYIWGALLGGSSLGIIAVLFALIPAPMTFIGRMLTSYPEMSVCFMLGSVATCCGILSKKPIAMLFGGIGVGIILLADTRGIIWAIPYFIGLIIAALFRGTKQNRIVRLVLLIIPIWYSYSLASQVYVFNAIGIEQQVDLRPMLYRWAKSYPPPWDYPSNFTWGMNPFSEFPKTIQFLMEQGNLNVPNDLISAQVLRGRVISQQYFYFAGLGALLAMFQWRRTPWRLFALFITLSPFLIGFQGALTMLEEHTRFYIQTLPGVIILWAIAWQGVNSIGAWMRPLNWKQNNFQLFIKTAILLSLILGSIPSILSPTAEWRREWNGTDSSFRDILSRYENGTMHRDPMQRFCQSAIDKNIKEDRPLTVTLYDVPFHQWFISNWK